MEEYFLQLSTFEKVMICISIIFSIMFLIQAVMTFLGISFGDNDGSLDGADGEGFGFLVAVFSIRNMTTFFACFGWTAFLLKQSNVSEVVSLVSGLFVGMVAIALNLLMLKLISTLSENGRFKIEDAVGRQGKVYTPIIDGEVGLIHVKFAGGLHELHAKSDENLSSHTYIEIVKVLGENLVQVRSV